MAPYTTSLIEAVRAAAAPGAKARAGFIVAQRARYAFRAAAEALDREAQRSSRGPLRGHVVSGLGGTVPSVSRWQPGAWTGD